MRIAFFLLGLGACLPSTQLEVTKSGAGSGTVTSDPGGIDCGDQCLMTMDAEGVVELTAKPADGDAFRGWSGDCSGTGMCTIDSSFDAEVDARFEKITNVTVQMKGAPTNVQVRSLPLGLTCVDGTCTGQFVRGTDVVLTMPLPADVSLRRLVGRGRRLDANVHHDRRRELSVTVTLRRRSDLSRDPVSNRSRM